MKQEQNCAVWSRNYPGFPCPGGESIVIPMGPPLRSLGTGTCRIWKPMLLQSFQHDVMAAALLREWKWAFPQRSCGERQHQEWPADFLVNPTKSPCIQTQSSMSSSKESYTTDSPENLCFSIITHLIQAGSKTKGQTASAPSSYHWQTHIPAGWS